MKVIKPLLASVAALVVASGFALSAHATQINGTAGFTSAPNNPGGTVVSNGGGSFTINFNNPLHVDFGSDDYSGVPIGTTTNFTSITFTNGGGLTSSNSPLWSFTVGTTTYSFDLLQLTTATFHNANPSALVLMGDGIAHITGRDDTPAIFALEATGNHLSFAILQPSNTAVPTPDSGSTVALLGSALVLVEALRRKLSSSKA
jgi:VPDSG-CTERM motif